MKINLNINFQLTVTVNIIYRSWQYEPSPSRDKCAQFIPITDITFVVYIERNLSESAIIYKSKNRAAVAESLEIKPVDLIIIRASIQFLLIQYNIQLFTRRKIEQLQRRVWK